MRMFSLRSGLCSSVSLGIFLIGSLSAQEVSPFTFSIGGGFTQPVGNTGRQLDDGWNIQGGAGMNFGKYLGVMVDLGYNSFGINTLTVNNAGATGGSLHVFSATLDPIVHLTPHSRFDIYVTGGGGIFHRTQEFSQPGTSTAIGIDPFFGIGPVTSSYSVNKPGIDVGAGIAFGTKWHGKVFAEAKYDRIYTNYRHTDYLPVTFGFRW